MKFSFHLDRRGVGFVRNPEGPKSEEEFTTIVEPDERPLLEGGNAERAGALNSLRLDRTGLQV